MNRLKIITLLFLIELPLRVSAQQNPLKSLEDVGTRVYGRSRPDSLPTIIGRIVQVVLGLLGIIFVLLIIWGGLRWMTAGGNEKALEEAKKRITSAVIGLVIVLAAYTIAYSVTRWLTKATSGGCDTYNFNDPNNPCFVPNIP